MSRAPHRPVSAETVARFDAISDEVERAVCARCIAEDDPCETMGDESEEMIRSGLKFVTRMLRTTICFAEEGILADELEWGKTRLPVYGVSAKMVLANFKRYAEALEEKLPRECFAELAPFIRGMLEKQERIASAALSREGK